MTTTRRTLIRAAAGFAVASPAILRAQPAWPAKPITIVVNFPAGGLTDGIARAFGQSVQQATGQQVIIDNKPGASGQHRRRPGRPRAGRRLHLTCTRSRARWCRTA